MNKLYIVSAITIASIVFVGAEQESYGREGMMRGVPTMAGQTSETRVVPAVRTTEAKYVSGKMGTPSQAQSGQVVRMMPPIDQMTTGDPVIDAQLKALTIEKEAKMKAIQEDYIAKVKAIIGNHTLIRAKIMQEGDYNKGQGSNNSNVNERMIEALQMKKAKEGERIRKMASSTEPSRIPVMMRAFSQENSGEVKPIEQRGVGAQFNNLFRGMFGGN